MGERTPDDEHLAADGRVMEILSEHVCQGWLEGYLLTGRHGAVLVLRGVRPHRRLDVQPARQVAQDSPAASRGGDPSPRSTTCSRRTSGARTTTASRTRTPGFIDHVMNKKAEVDPRLPPARRQHPAVRRRPLPAQPQLRQRHRRRQAAGADWLTMDEAAAHCARGPRHLGLGEPTRRRGARRRHGLRGRRPDARDAGRRRAAARRVFPTSACGSSTWST